MTPEEKDELLDRYVTGQPITAAEENQVDYLLKTDADFRTSYQRQSDLFEIGKRERRTAWAALPNSGPLPARHTVFPIHWAVAASVVLLMGLGIFWWLRTTDTPPLTGQIPLFEQRDAQLGLAGADSSAVGTVTWVVTQAGEKQYDFSQPDTLRIFSSTPGEWKNQTWRLVRQSEVRYQLRVGRQIYRLEQGRSMRLPLEPEK